jgi:Gram-negative bacterial TonB protein C-terminal
VYPARIALKHSGAPVTLFVVTWLFVISLGVLAAGEPISVSGPVYPPGAVAGGTVVAALHVMAGSVTQVEILAGEEPFTTSARDALRGWRFEPRRDAERIPVVLNFRNPNLFALSPKGQDPTTLRKSYGPSDVALPWHVVEPVYPANVLGQGSVILRLEIDDSGNVSDVNGVKSAGGLTDPCAKAVRAWKFAPARDQSGRQARSQAFAVCVFRHPVL